MRPMPGTSFRLPRLRVPGPLRGRLVIVLVALLAMGAVALLVSQLTTQMARDADARLDTHVAGDATALQELMSSAAQDIRLARRNVSFERALAHTGGQLLPADRRAVEAAITYLGERYAVDEICVIRANGLEVVRWVSGSGVAPVSDLSPDERQNNPAVLPTLELPDDSTYGTEPYVSPDSQRWVVGVATPIVLNDGATAGILHFEIPLVRFQETLTATPFSGTSYAFIVDRSGRLLVHPEIAAFRAGQELPADPNTAAFPLAAGWGSAGWREAAASMLGHDAGTASFDANGQRYRLSYHAIAGSEWIVGVAAPVDELYADVNRTLLNLAITAGPLLLMILAISAWFGRRVAGANRHMTRVNEELAATNNQLEASSRSSAELARESAVVNQFTELTAMSEDDIALSSATLATLDELLHPEDAAIHVSNQSKDRAVPQATLGEHESEVLSLHDLGRCPALRRSSLYVTQDVTARLAYRCPVYPVDHGTLACVPLVALGETVGAAHLHWSTPRDLSLPLRLVITRVAEHAALSIANRRLVLALRGQANTDARTGLTNSRSFDEQVERLLANRGPKDSLSVLMLDLDHFKELNDRFGHPAGDEALRVFANLLSSSIRDQDIAARYGGEEFAVGLPDTSAEVASEVAERIRARTEATIIPLSPGVTARLTVSIGVGTAPRDGVQLLSLLKAADEALYRAKLGGRNRVISRGAVGGSASSNGAAKPAGSPRRRRTRSLSA